MECVSSSNVHVDSGVLQGTLLGLLMFLIFINDLPSQVSSQAHLFAADYLLYRTIESDKDHHQLQADLVALEEWANKWAMHFNVKSVMF